MRGIQDLSQSYQMNKKIDLGGTGKPLQFIHANAYTPECYYALLDPLKEHYQVHLYRQRPLWPNESPEQLKNWALFADDLIDMMDKHGDRQVIGIGHSLGGIATWLASIKRPDLFSQVILIDPVVLPYWITLMSTLSPKSLMSKMNPIIKIAKNRRTTWKDRHEARQHLGSKKVFQRFHPAVFDDFLKYGLKEKVDGTLTLSYPREWEAQVYSTGPNMWSIMKQNAVPAHIIKAQYSDVITTKTWNKIRERVPQGSFYEMPNVGHLIPFEKPLLLADHIQEVLRITQTSA